MNAWLLELWAAPAALGFALLFNVPPRSLIACCTLAVLGHACRKAVVVLGGDIVLGTLFGGVVIGIAAEWWAKRHRMIPTVYSISAAIPMVPGTFMYKAVQGLLGIANISKLPAAQENAQLLLTDASINAVKASMILLALAFGIAAPILFLPPRRD
ncbi:MAG: threonine/serine exporter family protein [Formivibrio sp.]|nr:threonine/serine exporter family protein [Formivibrio sp.]